MRSLVDHIDALQDVLDHNTQLAVDIAGELDDIKVDPVRAKALELGLEYANRSVFPQSGRPRAAVAAAGEFEVYLRSGAPEYEVRWPTVGETEHP